jgi:hypothetical protein
MYKLFKDVISGNINTVIRLADNSYIPFDEQNSDYIAYLAWLAKGNTPLLAENT